MPQSISHIIENTKAILAERWPESSYLFEKMVEKANECADYAVVFTEYVEAGGTLALRRLVSDWEKMANDAIGGYTLAFSNDVAAIDSAHFSALANLANK